MTNEEFTLALAGATTRKECEQLWIAIRTDKSDSTERLRRIQNRMEFLRV